MSSPAATNRRAVFAAQAAVLAFAISVCALLALVLADRLPARLDATATRRHKLADQSLAIVNRLDRPVRLIVAVRMAALDRLSAQRLRDVLDAFAATGKLAVENIDLTTGKTDALRALLADLLAQDRAAIDQHAASVRAASKDAADLAADLQSIAERLTPVRDALLAGSPAPANPEQVRAAIASQAALLSATADELRARAADAAATLDRRPDPADPLPVPRADLAAESLRQPLATAARHLASAASLLDQLAGPARSAPASARQRAAALTASIDPLRDASARAALALERLPALRIFSVAKAVKGAQVALLVGSQITPGPSSQPTPPSVVALDLDELLAVRAEIQGGSSVDLRFRAEELITAGLSAFTPDPKPLAVILHGGAAPIAPRFAGFTALVERLRLRGMTVADWAAGADDTPPQAIADAQRAGKPIVYITVSPETRDAAAAVRMSKLAKRLEALADSGAAMLVSVTPSTLPAADQPDPMVAWLEPLGLRADSGRVLVEEFNTPAGRAVGWAQTLTSAGTTHPLAAAIDGLPTRLVLPIALELTPGSRAAPVITLPPVPSRWAESEWSSALSSRGAISPAPAGPRDRPSPPAGWVLAAAIERTAHAPAPAPLQRLVVIGSNGWFADPIVRAERVVDGSVGVELPGNLEFVEAAVWWLSLRDDRVLRSASAESVPLIPSLSDGQRSALAWGLIAGLPLATLLLGGIVLLRRR